MRKTAIIICLAIIVGCGIFLASVSVAPFEPQSTQTVSKAENSAPQSGGTSIDITISAVGDCTLAIDENYPGATSFEAEMQRVNNDYAHFLKLVKPILEKDDLTIANFEGTLSERGARQEKEYAFRANPEYVKVLTSSSVEAVTLANNHTYDFGEEAFSDTKTIMTDNGILWFEGKNYRVTEINGVKIGLFGANALTYNGKTQFPKIIQKLKEEGAQLIIASFHWGVERDTEPNETQISLAHQAIDAGADLVLGHHPHVLQGVEKYKGKYIIYSLGNFCFGGHKNPADKDTMIFRQTFRFNDGELADYDDAQIIPCSISSAADRNNYQPKPLSGDEFERVKNKIIELSSKFSGVGDLKIIESTKLK